MSKPKLIRITTVPISLEKLLEGQLNFMQKHFEVIAVSAEREGLEEFGRKNGLPTYDVEMTRQITPFKDLVAVYRLYKFLKKQKPEIVHTHTPKAGIVGMLAAKLARVPLRLHTVAGLPLMEAKGVKRKLLDVVEKVTYACATKIYPNSKGLKDFIQEEKLTQPDKLKIIGKGSSNGIDTSYFNPALYSEKSKQELRNQLNIPQSAFVFIFIGRLVSDKGINELVSAFRSFSNSVISDAQQKHQKPYLLLVGSVEAILDPLLPKTLQEIENNPQIVSVGYQQDVRPYLSISDALTFPSYREGFPNVVMQAGAMGLPAIVSDINGCNEIVIENKNGIIVPAKNKTALQHAMNVLLEDKELREQLKFNARQIIMDRYQRKEVWDALLKEYQELLGKKGISLS